MSEITLHEGRQAEPEPVTDGSHNLGHPEAAPVSPGLLQEPRGVPALSLSPWGLAGQQRDPHSNHTEPHLKKKHPEVKSKLTRKEEAQVREWSNSSESRKHIFQKFMKTTEKDTLKP